MSKTTTLGLKLDSAKPRWTLLPWDVLADVVAVLEHGARKYAPNNWKHVQPKERYADAALRHLTAWLRGERIDPESKLPHLAHAICSLMFLLWHDKR
jgi:hypothetical protein